MYLSSSFWSLSSSAAISLCLSNSLTIICACPNSSAQSLAFKHMSGLFNFICSYVCIFFLPIVILYIYYAYWFHFLCSPPPTLCGCVGCCVVKPKLALWLSHFLIRRNRIYLFAVSGLTSKVHLCNARCLCLKDFLIGSSCCSLL